MKIKVSKQGSKKLNEFYKKEWASEDVVHYGKTVAWESWIPKHFTLEAYEGNSIMGAISFIVNQDVAFIEMIITTKEKRRSGIGEILMNKLEEIAKKNDVHKIYLQTGKDWEAVGFYKKLGYFKTADVPNHYLHADYIEMTKFIA